MQGEGEKGRLRFAVAQMQSGRDMTDNLRRGAALIGEAAAAGAHLVALPENFAFMGSDRERAAAAQPLEGAILGTLREEARRHGIAVLGGSFLEASPHLEEDPRPFNTSVLVDAAGRLLAVYRKIHLFDVTLPDGTAYRESAHIRPGREIVTVEFQGVTCGMSVCYDLRFPELYGALARRGARVVFVPAAFTLATGKDHWLPLLQARAIENQVYVVAPAQFGGDDPRRLTYGHAAMVDPWGVVLAQAPDRECICLGEYDASHLQAVRGRIPVAAHRRPDLYPAA